MFKRSRAPQDVLDEVARRDKEAKRLGLLPRMVRGGPFEVRRFAGPERWMEPLEGLRVTHLTDLHVGRVTPMDVQHEAVAIANAQQPDLVALTGDFVCHSLNYLDELTDVLKRLNAPAIAVLGNHDYWAGGEEVQQALERAGVQVLRNQHTVLHLRGKPLQVVGLDDAYTGHADLRAATRGLRSDIPTLALSHIGEEADALWDKGAELVLAGHTHAGQVTLAGLHELAVGKLAGHKYVHGVYGSRRADTLPKGALYVGAGVGAAVMPLRLGERARREVTSFELGMAIGAVDEHHDDQPALKGRPPTAATKARRAAAVVKKKAKRTAKNGGSTFRLDEK
ncbi:MAG: metallophosphoesterase family protein [Polyangiales bacterium]